MLLSMTGFGKAHVVIDNQSLDIQIKSLNSKTLDIFAKLPAFLKDREVEIRTIIGRKLKRGKIDLTISNDVFGGCGMHAVNHKIARFYQNEIREMMFQLSLDPPQDYVSLLLKMPNVVQTTVESIDYHQWHQIEKALNTAIDELIEWRSTEGRALENDIRERILEISKKIDCITVLEPKRREKIYDKLTGDITALGEVIHFDKNRLEQELIYYLDKIDISEEITRAKKHCEYFLELIKSSDSNGKKLTFASQEILRELNTMGVKANDAEIQIITVEMKDEIEKVREQLSNIL